MKGNKKSVLQHHKEKMSGVRYAEETAPLCISGFRGEGGVWKEGGGGKKKSMLFKKSVQKVTGGKKPPFGREAPLVRTMKIRGDRNSRFEIGRILSLEGKERLSHREKSIPFPPKSGASRDRESEKAKRGR